jgi:hypothetical protein
MFNNASASGKTSGLDLTDSVLCRFEQINAQR